GPTVIGANIAAGGLGAAAGVNRVDAFGFNSGANNSLLHWPAGIRAATTEPWINWPTNQQKNPVAGHLRPESLEELVNIVEEAERLGRGVRAVGSSWSNSDVAVSPAYVVETDKLNDVLTNVLSTSLNARG